MKSTLELVPGDRLLDRDAVVREVSTKAAPDGRHYVATTRGTFLAEVEDVHLVAA